MHAGGAKVLFSWRSPSTRPLGVDESRVADDELFALMEKEPRLIRRPLVRTANALLVAPDARALVAAFA